MRSAIRSVAVHSSVYCVSNMRCSVLNIGPVTFQWKLCVFRYTVNVSARSFDRPSAIFARSLASMPVSIMGAVFFGAFMGSPSRCARERMAQG